MAFTRRESLLPLRVIFAAILGLVALHAAAQPLRDPKLKSSSVLIIDQSDSSVLYSR
jgi:hypothetical protein